MRAKEADRDSANLCQAKSAWRLLSKPDMARFLVWFNEQSRQWSKEERAQFTELCMNEEKKARGQR